MKTNDVGATLAVAQTRERIVIVVCAFAALGLGIVAASNSIESVAPLFIVLFFSSVAFILPRAWLGIVLIALIPLEFYFPITASFYLRGALVFVLAATIRVGVLRLARRDWRSSPWAIPAALFIIAATISALGASNRYAALKGIYDYCRFSPPRSSLARRYNRNGSNVSVIYVLLPSVCWKRCWV
jgi:hypothetical protein